MRTLRKVVDVALPLLGMLLVFSAVLLAVGLYTQLVLVTLGVLMIEAGIWKLANPLLPSERRYLALRREVDGFIPLARELNRAALALRDGQPDAASRFEVATADMHEAVDRMAGVAGIEGDVVPAGSPALS